jgi:hypothetical protein
MKEMPFIKGTLILDVANEESSCTVNNLWSPDIELEEDIRFDTEDVDCVGVLCDDCILNVRTIDLDYLLDKGHITKADALRYTLDLP